MTYAGARGETAAQMAQVMGFGTNQPQFASLFGELQAELEATQQTNALELNTANALWTQEGFPFLPAFLETATNQYQASVNQADFSTGANAATQDINNWVAQQTRNKIQNIVPSGAITSYTRLVLVNAIYFLGAWTQAFAASNTLTQPFYLTSNSQVQVPLMYQPNPLYAGDPGTVVGMAFNYMQGSNFQAIELPYASNQASMVILLPAQVDGLRQLEQQLSPAFLSGVLAQMQPQYLDLYLPRFVVESSFELTETLSEMGMPDAFTPGVADFSGIDGAEDLYITHVLHKAWGAVNEAGTEAAASTVVIIGITAVPMPVRLPGRSSVHFSHSRYPIRQPALPGPGCGPKPVCRKYRNRAPVEHHAVRQQSEYLLAVSFDRLDVVAKSGFKHDQLDTEQRHFQRQDEYSPEYPSAAQEFVLPLEPTVIRACSTFRRRCAASRGPICICHERAGQPASLLPAELPVRRQSQLRARFTRPLCPRMGAGQKSSPASPPPFLPPEMSSCMTSGRGIPGPSHAAPGRRGRMRGGIWRVAPGRC